MQDPAGSCLRLWSQVQLGSSTWWMSPDVHYTKTRKSPKPLFSTSTWWSMNFFFFFTNDLKPTQASVVGQLLVCWGSECSSDFPKDLQWMQKAELKSRLSSFHHFGLNSKRPAGWAWTHKDNASLWSLSPDLPGFGTGRSVARPLLWDPGCSLLSSQPQGLL